MKMPHLPEVELAKAAAVATVGSSEDLERALRTACRGYGWGYGPLRDLTADVLGAKLPMLGSVETPSWSQLEKQLQRSCNKGDDQSEANLDAGKALHEHAQKHGWSSTSFKMGELGLGKSGSVRFWNDLVVDSEEDLFIPFFDYRRSNGIETSAARQIIFSMQNVGVRERQPDLMSARLAVVSVSKKHGSREVILHFHEEQDLLSYEDLNARVQLVYETLARILQKRTEQTRRTGTGDSTPMGF